ncbi:MAG: hypothetical protein B6229_01590 [Spirochaetaceae bacterium 4572_7]|nr:MAG: hypothetical protein B6229_01590 [Spirochaetaceae bacterium 4572_7]
MPHLLCKQHNISFLWKDLYRFIGDFMLIIGHRGCNYKGFNQNTIRSFKKVLDDGVKAIEFDVQNSSDGALPIVHNLDLAMVSTGKGRVDESSSSYLRSIFAGKTENGEDKIPFLEDVLELLTSYPEEKRGVMHLELKGVGTGNPSGLLLKAFIEKGKLRTEDFLISSFNWKELQEIQSVCPDLKIALLDGAIRRNENVKLLEKLVPPGENRDGLKEEISRALNGKYYNDELIETALKMGAFSVNLWYQTVFQPFIEQVHDAGLKVFLYTVNEEKDFLKVADMGVDGFFTDDYNSAYSALN